MTKRPKIRHREGVCFYCRCHFGPKRHLAKGESPAGNIETKDHVFPVGIPLPPGLAHRGDAKNKVRSCFACNNLKGSMFPLAWLSICPADDGARDLAALLFELGVSTDTIRFALERRNRLKAKP